MPRTVHAERTASRSRVESTPALVAPSDPAGALARTDPERRLMLAVLSDAVVVLSHQRRRQARIDERDVAAATRWVRSDDRAWPCSFVNVCEALGLAPDPLRRALLAVRAGGRATRRRLLAGKRMHP